MAVLTATNPTLLDLAKRSDPNGKITDIVEILAETNEIMEDMSWMEGNLPTGHRTTVRTGLPTPTWRKLYAGVPNDKSTTVQITDNCGMLEAYAEIDKALADLNGNTAAFRLSEEKPFIEAISQEVADTIFYGNEGTEPEAFTGLAPRFNDLSAENGDNIIQGSGTTDTSIWLVVWGPNTCHGIIPKGSKAGLQMDDKGQVTLEDASNGSNSGRMEAYRTHYRFDAGLTVRDWRYIVRYQLDFSALSTTFTSGAFSTGDDISEKMFEMLRLPPNLSSGRPAFYMSRDVATKLAQQVSAKGNSSFLTRDNVGGDKGFTESFGGVPIRRCDALAVAETAVS